MANKLLGIHLAANVVKLVEVEQQRVINYSIDYFSSDKLPDAAVKTLSAALKNKKFSSHQAVLVLAGTEMYYKLVELPNMPEKEIEAALRFKLESAFSFPANAAVVDYYKINELKTTDKQIIFVAAVPKDHLNNIIKTVKKAGINIKEIIASSSALTSAAAVKDPNPYALVYIGKDSTSIALVKHGQVVFAREVAVGGDNITQAMVGEVQTETGKIELDFAKADELKNKFGVPMNPDEYTQEAQMPAAEIMAMMRPALEKIGDEISRTSAYYRETGGDQTEFTKAYFSGGVSKTKNFIAYFSAMLGITIEPMPLSTSSTLPNFENDAPYLSLAIGAAVVKKPYLSLLPTEFKVNYLALLKKYLWVIIGLFMVGLLFYLYASASNQYVKMSAELKILQAKVKQQEGAMAQQAAAAQALLKEFGSGRKTDRFVKVIGAVHRLTPSEMYFLKLNYDRAGNQFVMQGVTLKTGGKGRMRAFLERLKTNPVFTGIDLSYMQESTSYSIPTYDFEIKCGLAGGQP